MFALDVGKVKDGKKKRIPLVGSRVTFESDERYPEMASESLWDEASAACGWYCR